MIDTDNIKVASDYIARNSYHDNAYFYDCLCLIITNEKIILVTRLQTFMLTNSISNRHHRLDMIMQNVVSGHIKSSSDLIEQCDDTIRITPIRLDNYA